MKVQGVWQKRSDQDKDPNCETILSKMLYDKDAQKLWRPEDGQLGLYKRRKRTYEKLPAND